MQFDSSLSTWMTRRASRFLTLSIVMLLSGSLLAGCGLFGSDTTPPDPPAELSGTSLDNAVELEWSSVDADDLSGYNLYRSESAGDEIANLDPVNTEQLTETSYTDEGVDNGTTYYYLVTALDEEGNESGASNEARVTPFSEPPNRPEN